jgi:hypothetical protein
MNRFETSLAAFENMTTGDQDSLAGAEQMHKIFGALARMLQTSVLFFTVHETSESSLILRTSCFDGSPMSDSSASLRTPVIFVHANLRFMDSVWLDVHTHTPTGAHAFTLADSSSESASFPARDEVMRIVEASINSTGGGICGGGLAPRMSSPLAGSVCSVTKYPSPDGTCTPSLGNDAFALSHLVHYASSHVGPGVIPEFNELKSWEGLCTGAGARVAGCE